MNDTVIYGNFRHGIAQDAVPGSALSRLDVWIRFGMIGLYAVVGAFAALLHATAERGVIVTIGAAGALLAYGSWLRVRRLLHDDESASATPAVDVNR